MSAERAPLQTATARHVLVVEDDEDARALLEIALRRRGHDVVAVVTAEDGMERLRARSFDAIVTDENLPGMSGTEMLGAALSAGLTTADRAIVCTAHPFVRPPPGVRLMIKPLAVAAIALFVETRGDASADADERADDRAPTPASASSR